MQQVFRSAHPKLFDHQPLELHQAKKFHYQKIALSPKLQIPKGNVSALVLMSEEMGSMIQTHYTQR